MKIQIQDLSFKAIIGILKKERLAPQNIIVSCEIDYEKGFIDYADIVELIKVVMIEKKFGLIEDALTFLAQKLYEKYSNINEIELKIVKPDILKDCKVGVSKKFNFS